MANPYEILIRHKDGVYTGSHAIDTPGGNARPITQADLAAIAPAINAAALAASTAKDAAHAVELAAKDAEILEQASKASKLTFIKLAIEDPKLDALATIEAAKAAIAEAELPARERKDAETRKQIAALQATLGK